MQELRKRLMMLLRKPSEVRCVIILDAIDDCTDLHELALFLQQTNQPFSSSFRICYSCRQLIPILEAHSVGIAVEDHNQKDIETYVKTVLPISKSISQHNRDQLLQAISQAHCGVFLWVVLAVDLLQRYINKGRDVPFLQRVLKTLPKELSALYEDIIIRAVRLNTAEETQVMVRVLQWVLFCARSLSAEEWHHVVAFVDMPSLRSIRDWEQSEHYSISDDVLMRRLQSICCGLVEVRERHFPSEQLRLATEGDSLGPRAGSFESQLYVRVAHESVREYLLKSNAFSLMDPSISSAPGCGHGYIVDVCIRYTFLEEMTEAFRAEPSIYAQTSDGDSYGDNLSLGGSAASSCSNDHDSYPSRPLFIASDKIPKIDQASTRSQQERFRLTLLQERVADEVSKTTSAETYEEGLTEQPKEQEVSASSPISKSHHPLKRWSSTESSTDGSYEIDYVPKTTGIPPQRHRSRLVSNALYRRLESSITRLARSEQKVDTAPDTVLPKPEETGCSSAIQPLDNIEDTRVVLRAVKNTARTIESPPAFWQYCRDMLVHHAVAAEKEGRALDSTLSFLCEQDTAAWAKTRSDMDSGASPSCFAARWNLVSWLRYFREHGPSPPEGKQWWPANVAAKYNNSEAFCFLVPSVKEVYLLGSSYMDSSGNGVLHNAAAVPGSLILSYIRDLFTSGSLEVLPAIDHWNSQRMSPLHIAADIGCNKNVTALLALGARADRRDGDGWIALQYACRRADADLLICKSLVEGDTEENRLNDPGNTYRYITRRAESQDLISYFESIGLGTSKREEESASGSQEREQDQSEPPTYALSSSTASMMTVSELAEVVNQNQDHRSDRGDSTEDLLPQAKQRRFRVWLCCCT